MSRPATGSAITITASGKFRTSVPLANGKRRSADFDGREQAEQWRDTAIAAHRAGQTIPDPDLVRRPGSDVPAGDAAAQTISSLFPKWLAENYFEQGGTTATRANAVRAMWARHIEPWLSAFDLVTGDQVEREQVRALLAALAGRPHALLGEFRPGPTAVVDDTVVTLTEATQHGFARSTVKTWLRRKRLPGAYKDATGGWRIPLVELHRCRDAGRGPASWPPSQAYADGVIKDTWRILRSVLEFGATLGIDAWTLRFDPTSIRVPRTTQVKVPKPRMLTIAEVAQLARHLHPIHQLVLWLMMLLGLRISEVFGLHLRDLHGEQGHLFIMVRRMGGQRFEVYDADGNVESVAEVDRLKSSASLRIIPAPAHLVDLISVARRIFHRGDHDQRMIPRLNGGGGQAAFRNALQRAGQITGIDLTSLVTRDDPETGRRLPHPHDARKAYASLLRLAGVDPHTRKLLLGHAPDDDIHERVYLVEDPDMRERIQAVDALQRMLAQELPDGLAIPTTKSCTTGAQGFTGERRLEIDAHLDEVGWVARPTHDDGQRLLFSDDIAALSDAAPGTARRWLREGEIPSVTVVFDGKKRNGATRGDVESFLSRIAADTTLMAFAEEVGEDPNTLRQRIHALKLPFETKGRVMILPEETQAFLRAQVERFDYLERHWLPLSEAAAAVNVSESVIKAWVRSRALQPEVGRGQRMFIDPAALKQVVTTLWVPPTRHRRR